MNPRVRAAWQLVVLLLIGAGLLILFPRAMAFVELAARELRYFWWLILMLALAIWLIWAGRRRS